ncbi:MAG: YIP1 family protein [Nanoarchaeota archaeon]
MFGYIIQTAGRVLFYPKRMCERIPRERYAADITFIYLGILALIPAIAKFIELSVVSILVNNVPKLRVVITAKSFIIPLAYLVLIMVSSLAVSYIYTLLAGRFGGKKDFSYALKVVAYAMTPILLSPIFGWIPSLSYLISLLAIVYAVYILYLGIAYALQPRQEVRFFFILASILILVFFLLLIEFIINRF